MKKCLQLARSFFAALYFLVAVTAPVDEHKPLGSAALEGLETARTVYDIRTKEPGRLLLHKVMQDTARSTRANTSSRNSSCRFEAGPCRCCEATRPRRMMRSAILKEVRQRLGVMRTTGMKLEACNVAATALEVNEGELTDEVTLVGNSLISLAGYQNKGYALVPMY